MTAFFAIVSSLVVVLIFLSMWVNGSKVAGACLSVAMAAVLVPMNVANARAERARIEESMRAEIDAEAYAALAERKGRSCALDRAIAKAMADGRMTVREYVPVRDLAERERLTGARDAVAGISPSRSCSPPRAG